MRAGVYAQFRGALIRLFKHAGINSQVFVHSHTLASAAIGAIVTGLFLSNNTKIGEGVDLLQLVLRVAPSDWFQYQAEE